MVQSSDRWLHEGRTYHHKTYDAHPFVSLSMPGLADPPDDTHTAPRITPMSRGPILGGLSVSDHARTIGLGGRTFRREGPWRLGFSGRGGGKEERDTRYTRRGAPQFLSLFYSLHGRHADAETGSGGRLNVRGTRAERAPDFWH